MPFPHPMVSMSRQRRVAWRVRMVRLLSESVPGNASYCPARGLGEEREGPRFKRFETIRLNPGCQFKELAKQTGGNGWCQWVDWDIKQHESN